MLDLAVERGMNEWGAVEPAAGIAPAESNGQVTEEVLGGNGWVIRICSFP